MVCFPVNQIVFFFFENKTQVLMGYAVTCVHENCMAYI